MAALLVSLAVFVLISPARLCAITRCANSRSARKDRSPGSSGGVDVISRAARRASQRSIVNTTATAFAATRAGANEEGEDQASGCGQPEDRCRRLSARNELPAGTASPTVI